MDNGQHSVQTAVLLEVYVVGHVLPPPPAATTQVSRIAKAASTREPSLLATELGGTLTMFGNKA